MESAAEAGFLAWCEQFFMDESTPSPLSLSLHPHLAIERALLIALARGSTLDAFLSKEQAGGFWATAVCGGGAAAVHDDGGAAAAPAGPPASHSMIV